MPIEKYTAHQFENFFDQIFDDKIDDNSVKNFLLDINSFNIPTNSIIGAISSLKKRMIAIPNHEDALDVCGTGGDKLNTLNISTAVAIILAYMNIKVAKHGNRAISSKSGSADIFSQLNIKFDDDLTQINKNLCAKKLCFLFAPNFHPALKKVVNIRKSIAEPTIFNYIGPLLNPVNPRKQIIGLSRIDIMPKIAEVVAKLKPNAKIYLVHGFDGMDEISLSQNSYLVEVDNSFIKETAIIDPTNYGLTKRPLEDIIGKDPEYNAHKMLELFAGKLSSYQEIVSLNCAFALTLVGRFDKIIDGINYTDEVLKSGKIYDFAKNLSS